MEIMIPASRVDSLYKKLKQQKKSLVLAGGCFDILHPGHIVFLEKAKKMGDILVVLLESDQKVRLLKGKNRPIHTQVDRAKVLLALKSVDFVILLPFFTSDSSYDQLIAKLQPRVIAVTAPDSHLHHKQRAAKLTGAKLKYVTKKVGHYSSSNILKRYA